jgi:hypothetical protein
MDYEFEREEFFFSGKEEPMKSKVEGVVSKK